MVVFLFVWGVGLSNVVKDRCKVVDYLGVLGDFLIYLDCVCVVSIEVNIVCSLVLLKCCLDKFFFMLICLVLIVLYSLVMSCIWFGLRLVCCSIGV